MAAAPFFYAAVMVVAALWMSRRSSEAFAMERPPSEWWLHLVAVVAQLGASHLLSVAERAPRRRLADHFRQGAVCYVLFVFILIWSLVESGGNMISIATMVYFLHAVPAAILVNLLYHVALRPRFRPAVAPMTYVQETPQA